MKAPAPNQTLCEVLAVVVPGKLATSEDWQPERTGLWLDLPADVYRTAPGVCQSALKFMAISPAHYRHYVTAPPELPTPAQRIGTAVHDAVLLGRKEYAVRPDYFPDYRTKAAQQWRDQQLAPILTEEEDQRVNGMCAAIASHPLARAMLRNRTGANEVSVFWKHPSTELLLKARADRITMDDANRMVVIDLKTCGEGDAMPDTFAREMAKWHYHRQAAFYLDAFGASLFVFIVIETTPPFGIATYYVEEDTLSLGRAHNQADLIRLAQCIRTDTWPGYPDTLRELSLPDWFLKKEGWK